MAKSQIYTPPVRASSFSLRSYSAEEAELLNVCDVVLSGSKDDLKSKVPGSIYDLRMGPYDSSEICLSCRRDYGSCPGHYGLIRLALPIYNPAFFDKLIFLLKATCFGCMRITVPMLEKLVFCVEMLLIKNGRHADLSMIDELFTSLKSDGKSDFEISVIIKRRLNDILANCPRADDGFACQNEVGLKFERIQKFENAIRSSRKRCMYCRQMKPKITHDGIFDILDSTETKSIRGGGPALLARNAGDSGDDWITLDDLIEAEDETETGKDDDDAIKGTPITANQRGYIPLNVKYILDNLWKNERVLLKIYYGCSSQSHDFSRSTLFDRFMIKNMIVVPPRFRPLRTAGVSLLDSIDKQSAILNSMIKCNNELRSVFEVYRTATSQQPPLSQEDEENSEGPPVADKDIRRNLYSVWKHLQIYCGQLFDVKYSSKRLANAYKGLRGIIEAKEGLIRKNIMGKRVDYAGRSVISPDPFIATHEIGIPVDLAIKLDYPEPVNAMNVDWLKRLIVNGPNKYPGARFVKNDDGRMIRIKPNDPKQRQSLANQLSEPCRPRKHRVVYRHLLDGDYLMINRQPTLHRPSFMGHSARVLRNEKVLRLHYSNCKSYNADFDGDELNVHFPQSQMSRTEVAELMLNTRNYLAPKDGAPLGGLIHDHIIAATKLSTRGTLFTREQYVHLINQAFTGTSYYERLQTLTPCIIRPIELWSGKQVISTVLLNLTPPRQPGINLESTAKVSDKYWLNQKPRAPQWSSPNDSRDPWLSEETVVFRNGRLLSGVIDKNQVGSAPRGLIHCCQELFDGYFANSILSALSRLFTSYLQFFAGFTLGADDILLRAQSPRIESIVENRVKSGHEALHRLSRVETKDSEVFTQIIRQAHQKADESLMIELDATYKAVTDKLQSQMTNALFSKQSANSICEPLKSFPSNDLHFMILSGAKGSAVNALQMSCMLGQQELEGRRPALMASGASLPCFEPYDLIPDAGGFIYNSFSSGLRPHEYFFHCMAGREGLVDTAVKTSRSGYLQRCLIKHLEGLVVQYDMTVRNSDGSIVQFCYGEDGIAVENSSFLKPTHFKLFTENADCVRLNRDSFERSVRPPVSNQRLVGLHEKVRQQLTESKRIAGQLPKQTSPVLENVMPGTKLEAVSEKIYDQIARFAQSQSNAKDTRNVLLFKTMCAVAQPGEAVGLIAAQSIGEPSTQMTLNTFHFAGRGEMNVTLGIPRLREILMTTTRNIKTPLMEVPILAGKEKHASRLQRRLERLLFEEVIKKVSIKESLNRGRLGRGIVQTFGIRFDFRPRKGIDVLASFELRFVRQLLTNISQLIKNRNESSLFRTVLAKTKGSAVKDDAEEGEEGEVEPVVGDEDEVVGEQDLIGDDGECGKLRKQQDDEYDGEDDDQKEIEEAVELDRVEEEVVEEESIDDLDPQPKRAKSTTVDFGRIDAVMAVARKFSGIISVSDYRHSPPDSSPGWCEITLEINAAHGQVNMSSIVDRTAKTLAVRSSDAIKKCGIVELGVGDEVAPWMQVEGINFNEIFNHNEVFDLNRFYCNSILHMCERYGIEACQRSIVKECQRVFSAYGINVDFRHLTLIADYLTFSGKYTAFNRQSMTQNASPLQKMSFETATTVIKDCVLRGFHDDLQSPSARQFVGTPSRVGTGMVDVLCKTFDG